VIDLHCHLLPGIDDGPATVADAVAQARGHLLVGVTTVAATPHASPSMPNDADGIRRTTDALRSELAARDVALEVVTGAEVDLAWGLDLDDRTLSAMTLGYGGGSGGSLLVEAPLRLQPHVALGIRELLVRGHRVLLAHPERSPVFHREPKALAALVKEGVRVQVTAGALSGRFGGTVQRHSRALVDAGLCHVVASDAHDVRRRHPGMADDLRAAGLENGAAIWCDEIPSAILAGADVPAVVYDVGRRRRFGRRPRG
jgi:protein-tyrosine phosphatase